MRLKRKIAYFVRDNTGKLHWISGQGFGVVTHPSKMFSATHRCRYKRTALRHARRIIELGGRPLIIRVLLEKLK